MEQLTIQKMELNTQLIINLRGLGFEEIKPNLYRKQITENTMLYRDYRKRTPSTYAYFKTKRIFPYNFKEVKALIKIEESLSEFPQEKLVAYS